ncbi:MAG TPA: hypothetical protein VG034_05090 [Acidimicrobiia bacterium]|jgi:hypothetical protein|nr:hypothetical protein [Acidimicrobiia bacterium]
MSVMRRILLVATATLVWLGVAAAPASAHSVSGVSGTNFETTLRSVAPPVPGLDVKVVEVGSRLEVENRTGQELIVLGYKGEPYLRIGPDGVFENRLSPATYLNRSRKGGTPTEAAEKAKVGDTDWAKVSSEPVARWHDHRIHWMGNINPPEVRNSPGTRHVIKMSADDSQWAVRMRLGNQDLVAKGDLVWQPGPSPLPWFALILASLALVVVLGRRVAWGSSLAAITALLLAIDVFHTVGLGLANAGDLGYRLTKSITQSPYEPLAWAVGILAIVWLRRGRSDGLSLAALSGLQIALLGGIGDLAALSRTVVPFGFGANLARLAVALSAGLGFGITAVAAMRLAGVGGSVRARSAALPDEAVAASTGS